MRKVVLALCAVALTVAFSSIARAQNACTADRLKEAAKLTLCETKCNAKAIKKGESLPETGGLGCRVKCLTKDSQKTFKIELKHGATCPTLDWNDVKRLIDDSTDQRTCQGGDNNGADCTDSSECPGGTCLQLAGLVPDLDCALTFSFLPFKSKCSAAKYKEAGKKASSKLKCYAKAQKKNQPVDPECLTKAGDKFLMTKCPKAMTKGDCHGPRHNLCNLQSTDCTTLEARVDLFLNDMLLVFGITP